jgi:hypothetical protein
MPDIIKREDGKECGPALSSALSAVFADDWQGK